MFPARFIYSTWADMSVLTFWKNNLYLNPVCPSTDRQSMDAEAKPELDKA